LARPRTTRHISFRLTAQEALAKLERLDGSISDFMRDLLLDYLSGRLVERGRELKPLDAAKLKGVEIDNKLKQKRLDDYDDLTELKRQKLRADITLAQSRTRLSDVALARLVAPIGDDGYRYILAFKDGTHSFYCPICGKTIATSASYNACEYLPNKLKLVNHLADQHQVQAIHFDRATSGFFDRFELKFFGRTYPACPVKDDYTDGQLFVKELPSP